MKKQLLTLLALALALGTSAFAQSTKVKADVPFNFVVSGVTLPAGQYSLDSIAQGTLAIRNADQKANRMVLTNRCQSLDAPERTKLVFHRYGDRYFLAQIWVAGENSGREIPKSHREAEMALDYTVQNVVLYAALR